VVLLLAFAGAGCAAHWAYRQGQQAADKGDWDLAVARFTKALQKDPNNIRFKISLESARIQASRIHYDEAKKALAAQDLEKAAEELQIASNYDPANRSAADDLAIVRQRILKRDAERRDREELEQKKARAQAAARVPLPVLSPRSPVPITMRFEDGSLQKIFESLGRIAGVNVLFDEGFRDKKASVNLTGVTFQEALDRLTFVNRLFYKVVDQNTIIIVPESRQKRVAYDELLLRTFYITNAEINDTVNLVKTLAKVTTVAGNPSIGAITVLGTVDQVAMAGRIIDANDKARGEVVVEVQILEVDRNNLKKWGIELSNYTASLTLSPTGAANEVSNGVLTTRAYLLSSLNLADWVVSIPSTVMATFLQNDATVRILAAPKLRAAEGKKAELKIGTEIPIPQTSYTVGLSGGTSGGYLPATSFTYKNVGVNLSLTPRVAATGDVTLELAAEFSLLGDNRNVSSEANPILVPTFLTRNVTGVLRLRDGETGLIGGLVQGREANTFAGAIGVNEIPILGKLFGHHERNVDDTEVLMSITPRVVRAPKVTDEDLVPLRVGTQEVPKVEGARPPLFGEPETTPEGQGEGAGAATPAAPPPQAPGPAPEGPLGPTPEEQRATSGPGSQARPPAAAPPAAVAPPFPELQAPPVTPPATPAPSTSPAAATARPPAAGAPSTAAQATVLLSPPEVALKVGQVGTLAVVLVGAKDVQSIEINVTWNPSVAEVTDIAPGSLLTLDGTPVTVERAIESGHARVRFARATGAVGSGAVASVTIRGSKVGSGPVAVESLVLGRPGGQDRPALPAPGRIVVAP
jgi:general secretion pathway protein D